jgi:hypothetical protein
MATLPETRDLAQRLLHHEASAGNTSEPAESTTLRVYEKLRGNLCVLVGVAGFQALASRALTLARSEVPGLRAVQVAADGGLQRVNGIEPPMKINGDWIDEEGVIFISSLLGLLLMFLGEALTMNLVLNVWPDAALDDAVPRTGEKREHTR